MKRERGADAVFDFSLGNPDVEPPPAVLQALRRIVADNPSGSHSYMPNPGYAQVREAVAGKLRKETGLDFTAEDVVMTAGAAGACNVILKSILDPGDEVIVLMPFFPEYQFYIANHGGRMVPVETDATFLPDVGRIEAAITSRTRAILLNTPNNPPGRRLSRKCAPRSGSDASTRRPVHHRHQRRALQGFCLRWQAAKPKCRQSSPTLQSATRGPSRWDCPASASATWRSRPRLADVVALRAACAFSNRILGFINAPAIWQRVMLESMNETIDAAPYEHKRNVLCDALEAIGYDVRRPEGSFYIYLKTPIPDDVAFTQLLANEGVLAVPGTGFGRSGYIRLSLTIPLERIEKSIAGFQRAFACA